MKVVSKTISFVLLAILFSSTNTLAGTAAPWDGPLTSFLGLFQGKIALGIFFLIAIAATWALVKGGELDDWARKCLIGVIAVAGFMGITTLFNTLFGAAGYLI